MADLAKRYRERHEALRKERASFIDHWRDLSDHILPRRSRFLVSDAANAGTKRNSKIINSTPTLAARVLGAGMMDGLTSPSRPWFRLTTPDQALAELGPVKTWLADVEQRIAITFQRSNVYNALQAFYLDLGVFGTAVKFVDEDEDDIVRAYVLPIGSYCLQNSARLAIDTLFREFRMTVGQVVKRFGLQACSARVQERFKRGQLDEPVDIAHAVEPNDAYRENALGPDGMKFRSVWWEKDNIQPHEQDAFLHVGGYHENPVIAARWDVTGEDVYGSSPGMVVLGDCRALQLYERRAAQLVDKLSEPPMAAPAALRTGRVSLIAGDVTYVDASVGGQKLEPAMVVNPAGLGAVRESRQDLEARIQDGLYATAFRIVTQRDKDMTAREVAELANEKMAQLGPVNDRLQDELLDPLIERTFGILARSGQLPPIPAELEGVELKVEFLSSMTQARKMVNITSIERLARYVGGLSEKLRPETMDVIDWDQTVQDIGESLGVPPRLIRADDDIERLRTERAQQQQAQQQLEQAAAAAQTAKTLAQAPMDTDNGLTRLAQAYGGPAPLPGGVA